MVTIYVFSVELMDGEDDFTKRTLIDQYEGKDHDECLAWYGEKYDINDYLTSFTAPID